MNNKIIKIFLLSICLLEKQSHTSPFQKILLACGAIPAFDIAYYFYVNFYVNIMENKIVNRINNNTKLFEHSLGTKIYASKEYHNFKNERKKTVEKLEYSKLLKSLHEYNRCLEDAIKHNLTFQHIFNDCNEHGLKFLK